MSTTRIISTRQLELERAAARDAKRTEYVRIFNEAASRGQRETILHMVKADEGLPSFERRLTSARVDAVYVAFKHGHVDVAIVIMNMYNDGTFGPGSLCLSQCLSTTAMVDDNVDFVRFLLDRWSITATIKLDLNDKIFSELSRHRSYKIMRLLLEATVKSFRSLKAFLYHFDHRNLLKLAVESGHDGILERIISKIPKIDVVDVQRLMRLAEIGGHVDVFRILLCERDEKWFWSYFMEAVEGGNEAMVRCVLDKIVATDQTNRPWTMMDLFGSGVAIAAKSGHKDLMRLLHRMSVVEWNARNSMDNMDNMHNMHKDEHEMTGHDDEMIVRNGLDI